VKDASSAQAKLVLLQVDGLARKILEKALQNGECPALRRIKDRGYTIRSLYPGLPSSTPAVQAELLYGVKCAVPAFSFCERKSQKVHIMRSPESAAAIEKQLDEQSTGLLQGGSSYSNVYGGGAEEVHVVPARATDINSILKRWKKMGLYTFSGLLKTYARIFAALPFELVYALGRAIEGIFRGEAPLPEFKMIPTRILIAVYTREVIREGVCQDIRRGLPIIHANFLAYDEAAHRRGPDSKLAHNILQSVDDVIGTIDDALRDSDEDYRFYIYSDHGQENVQSYTRLDTNVNQRIKDEWKRFGAEGDYDAPLCCSMGPISLVYLDTEISHDHRAAFAHHLERHLMQGGVLYVNEHGTVMLSYQDQQMPLREGFSWIADPDAWNAEMLLEDLERLAKSPKAGDLLVLGWRKDAEPISFAEENGAHGGPGSMETEGFVLSNDTSLKEPLRAQNLYERWMGIRERGETS